MHQLRILVACLLSLSIACSDASSQGKLGGGAATLAEERLVLAAPVHHVDRLAREPMLVEHPGGALFVAGYGSQVTGTDPEAAPHLWKSGDGGASWRRVDVGSPHDGAIGNSDVDLAVGPDGTLYFASMGFDRSTRYGTHIAMGVSRDVGATWDWTLLSDDRGDDRPWVAVGSEGAAHAVWNDGSGVSHAVSTDRGASWLERDRVHPRGGSSHLAVGPAGELAVRITPLSASGKKLETDVDLVAVSIDGGTTWNKHPAPGETTWSRDLRAPTGVPRWVEPLAWDADGVLYHLWSEGRTLKLGRSLNHGATWDSWQVAEEAETAYFPYLLARARGELAATWFSGRGESLFAHVALITVPSGSGEPPRVLRAEPFQPDSWLEREGPPSRDPAGEYIPVVFLADGRLGLATPIQDLEGERFGFSWWRAEVRPVSR